MKANTDADILRTLYGLGKYIIRMVKSINIGKKYQSKNHEQRKGYKECLTDVSPK